MFNRKILMLVTAIVAFGAMAFVVATNEPMAITSVNVTDNAQRNTSDEIKITDQEVVEINAGNEELSTAKATLCDGEWMGAANFALNNWFTGQEYYGVYQDPTETGCPAGTTYPFEVQNVIWHVYNPSAAPFDIDLQPVIYSSDDIDPVCPKPGAVCCYGPLYTVTIPAGPGSVIVTLPLDSGCCVYGPYFAGVWAPDFIGTGILGVVTDSVGVPGTFGSRVCASYNNYQGLWEDLIVDYLFPGNLRLWSDGMASDMNNCDQCAQIIEPGVDLWTTPPGSSFDEHFTVQPLPADFFEPGSDPFDGRIELRGLPLTTDPIAALGVTDAIVLRGDRVVLPTPGSSASVPIEIVALDLVSTQPIVVTYNGGQNPELWDVRVNISSQVPQQQGQMTITKDCCNGGTFTSDLPVTPKFTFTRQSDAQVRLVDPPTGLPPIVFQTTDGHWSYEIPDPFDMKISPGLVVLDHDNEPLTPDILVPPSSKFTPGFRTVPCSPTSPDDPYCGGKVLTLEQEMLAQHGVLPPQRTTPVEGACCLPDGSCIITTIECCEEIAAGLYQGNFVPCASVLCIPTIDAVFDTLCTIAEIVITPSPSDANCLAPLPAITLNDLLTLPTVVQRSPDTPYTASQTIQTEMLQMELTGSSPLGPITVRAGRNFGLPPSTGSVNVTGVDGSGNLTGGTAFFDVFVEITIPSTPPLINLVPIPLEAVLPSLPPPPGLSFSMPPTAPPILLVDAITGAPFGYLCDVIHTIVVCDTPCCVGIRGDVNGDGSVNPNILDLNFLVNYIFRSSGNPGPCPEERDVNGDGSANPNILDLNWLVNYIFRNGPPPGPCP